MIMVNIFEAKAKLSEYLEAAANGERVLICTRNRPAAELRALAPPGAERRLGTAAGTVTIRCTGIRSTDSRADLRGPAANDNIVANMPPDAARLGEVEQLVLLAVLRLEGDAYAVPIRDLIQRQTGIALARGSIYITLDRLEQKGLVDSRMSDPTPEPGGKARRVFRIRPSGVAALRAAQRAVERLAAGTILEKKV